MQEHHTTHKTDEVSSKENRWLKTTQKSYSSTILKEKNTSKDWTAWKAYEHSHLLKGGETFSLFQSLQSTEVVEVGEKVISLPPCYLCYKMSPFLSLLQSPVKSSSRLFFGEDELPSLRCREHYPRYLTSVKAAEMMLSHPDVVYRRPVNSKLSIIL